MYRIKVTGYILSDWLPPSQLDPEHATGLSPNGFANLRRGGGGHEQLRLSSLEDLTFEKEHGTDICQLPACGCIGTTHHAV